MPSEPSWKKGRLTRPLRVAWLKEHEDLWAGKQLDTELRKNIVKQMKADGVLHSETYWRDVSLERIISELEKKVVN